LSDAMEWLRMETGTAFPPDPSVEPCSPRAAIKEVCFIWTSPKAKPPRPSKNRS
jgi:hypothetical protein